MYRRPPISTRTDTLFPYTTLGRAEVVPDAELLDRALAIADRIVCNPPRALRLTKRLLREAQHSRMSDILELSAAYQAIVHETADNREAIDAFVEKRAPVFTGE